MAELLKFSTNSYAARDVDNCGLKHAFYKELFEKLTGQKRGDVPDFDFNLFGKYTHVMFRLPFKQNFASRDAFVGMGRGLFALYLDQHDMYETRPGGLAAYKPRIRPMQEEFWDFHQGERGEATIGCEVQGRISVNTGRYLVGLGGRIDRLWLRNGREVATDYKTTSRRQPQDVLRREPQFLIHSLMRRAKTGEFPDIEVYYPGFSLGGMSVPTETVSFRATEEEVQEFYGWLENVADKSLSILENLKRGERIEPEYGKHCFLCEYAVTGVCDEYTGNNENIKYKAPLRIAPKKIPVRKISKKYKGLLRLRGWPRKHYIKVPEFTEAESVRLF